MARKKAEREKELSDYAECGGIGAKGAIEASAASDGPTIPKAELEKRQRLAAKLKQAMASGHNS